MRKLAYLIGLSLLVCASAFGQEERTTTDVTLSYSYIRVIIRLPIIQPTSTSTEAQQMLLLTHEAGSESSATSAAITWIGLIRVWEPICSARESICRRTAELLRLRKAFSAWRTQLAEQHSVFRGQEIRSLWHREAAWT